MKAPELPFSGTILPLQKRLKILTAYDGRPLPPDAFCGRYVNEACDR